MPDYSYIDPYLTLYQPPLTSPLPASYLKEWEELEEEWVEPESEPRPPTNRVRVVTRRRAEP